MTKIKSKFMGYKLFSIINYIVLAGLAGICIFPILHILAISFSSAGAAAANKVVLWPIDFNIQSYQMISGRLDFLNAFLVSLQRVAIGITINTVISIMMAYPLSKKDKEFSGRKVYVWSLIFVMLFNGGIVPNFILIKNLNLLNTIWALVLPGAVPIFNVILMMNFIKQLPIELEEAAFLDGASYWLCLYRIIIPLSKPVIATVVLFGFLGHWNSWFDGLIYMSDPKKYPLQTFMYNIVANRDITSIDQASVYASVNDKTLKASQLFVSMLPILLVYPFLQKHFTKGLTLGAVKG